MKKLISIIIIGVLFYGLTLTVSANESFDTTNNSKSNELIEKGFPQRVIKSLDENTINKIYQKIQNDGVTNITSNQETFFIEFPMDSTEGVQTRGAISSSQLKIVADVMNYGNSKGLTMEHVLIYPTKPIMSWLKDRSKALEGQSRAKLYVAITRARVSVAFIDDSKRGCKIPDIPVWVPSE